MPRVEVGESRIGGLGVFSAERLRAGDVIRELVLGREVTPDAPLRPERGECPEHCTWIDGRFHLLASPDRHFNHSCDPNAWLRFAAGRIEVVTRRDVEAGDELTLDYLINNPGGHSWTCSCGAPRCRGETGRSFFVLPQEIQREYLPLLAAWFRERYAGELEHLVRR
jgi:hypothetical protein